jgi:prepilin-type N-terminal cleavage/methylation domain-containing protein
MLNKLRKSNKDGFTIIEVMIVLAIAGLILLIVFLAVPALQRSSRNTQRKNDAASIGAAIANYISNNGGSLPTRVAGDGTNTNNLVLSSTATNNTETAKLGYYVTGTSGTPGANTGNIYIKGPVTAVTTPSNNGGAASAANVVNSSIVIELGENCDTTGTKGGTVNPRTAAIFYVTESGSGNGSEQCIEQ